jgi:integrase
MMLAMGRRRTVHHDLPPHMHAKGRAFYYGRKWVPLGSDFAAALKRYAELHGTLQAGTVATFTDAANHYRAHVLKTKAVKTQREYERQLKRLCKWCGAMPLSTITPAHVQKYLDKRSAKHSATREKALLSLVFNIARGAGLTNTPNPCAGIHGVKSKRDVYVTDDQLAAVLEHADRPLADFLELAWRTGADAAIVLRMTRADVRDGALWVQRSKTGAKVRIELIGPLARLLDRQEAISSVYLVHDDRGQPFSLQRMRLRFWDARAKAEQTWTIRDLRAKAGSDSVDLKSAQTLLGHAAESTTAIYRRSRIGERAQPITTELQKKR